MDLIIKQLNKVTLNVMTNDGEHEITLTVDQSCVDKPTMQFSKEDRFKKASIHMPFNGMILRKVNSEVI